MITVSGFPKAEGEVDPLSMWDQGIRRWTNCLGCLLIPRRLGLP